MPTLCNPMDLPYRFVLNEKRINREAADPSVIEYAGKFWLFPSKTGGYYWSTDLLEWHFVKSEALPTEDYAPDVRVINGWIYFAASRWDVNCPFMRTKNPLADEWEIISESYPFWDPNMFQDVDGRVYFYWGCSNTEPIYGVEVDPETMAKLGEPIALIEQNHERYGWERKSENSRESRPPHIEGAWMTLYEGRYYLQYAGPGTEFNTYADGVYVGDSPLGPFTYAESNPVSFQPGGFATGAGHGSTFQDTYGNWWHISTIRISVKHDFERRLGLWPAGFDKDGVMFCNNRFGDLPKHMPTGPWADPWIDPWTGWMLLSYDKPVTCSSADPDCPAEQAVNESLRDYWAAAEEDTTPWLTLDLGDEVTIEALQINFAEHAIERPLKELWHQYALKGSRDGTTWETLVAKEENSEDVPHDYIPLDKPAQYRYVKLEIHHMAARGRAAVSGLRVFGKGIGEKPATPGITGAQLLAEDPLTAAIDWEPVPGAIGYNLRWGIAPDKLYHDWLLYGANHLDLTAINKDQPTWVAVEAFNENGVSTLSEAVLIRV